MLGGLKKCSDIVGVTDEQIGKWRDGKSKPQFFAIGQLASSADVRLEWLLSGKGSMQLMKMDATEASDIDKTIPVMGSAAGSINGSTAISSDVIDRIARPHGLANARHAYALYVVGQSMQPKFKQGDIIFVHPGRPPSAGDIVVVQTQDYEGADVISYVKEYIGRSDEGILTRQYNDPLEIEFKDVVIKDLHRVMTTNELLGV